MRAAFRLLVPLLVVGHHPKQCSGAEAAVIAHNARDTSAADASDDAAVARALGRALWGLDVGPRELQMSQPRALTELPQRLRQELLPPRSLEANGVHVGGKQQHVNGRKEVADDGSREAQAVLDDSLQAFTRELEPNRRLLAAQSRTRKQQRQWHRAREALQWWGTVKASTRMPAEGQAHAQARAAVETKAQAEVQAKALRRREDAKTSAKLLSKMLQEAAQVLDIEQGRCQHTTDRAEELARSARAATAQEEARLGQLVTSVDAAGVTESHLDEEFELLTNGYKQHHDKCSRDTVFWKLRLKSLRDDERAVHAAMDSSPCEAIPGVAMLTQVYARHHRNATGLRGFRSARVTPQPQATAPLRAMRTLKLRTPEAQQALRLALSQVASRSSSRNLVRRMQHRQGGRRGLWHHHHWHRGRKCPGAHGCRQGTSLLPEVCEAPGRTDCQAAEEAVILLAAELQDQQQEARQGLAEQTAGCRQTFASFTAQLQAVARSRDQLQVSTANVAARRAAAEEETRQKKKELQQAVADLSQVRRDCEANLRTFQGRVCELKQLRAGVLSVADVGGSDVQDCEVSPWVPEACTLSCGGGTQRLTRRVVTPAGPLGAACPHLVETRACGTAACPVDCSMSEWREWSACSAACGEGTRTRTRSVSQRAESGGEPCPEENQLNAQCNVRPCDVMDCTWSAWSPWSTCSRACGGGLRQRSRAYVQGEGACRSLDAPEEQRLQYSQCHKQNCTTEAQQSIPRCSAKLDIAIVLDGSGGCSEAGFERTKAFAQTFISALELAPEKVQVAFTVAGGPSSWANYKSCLAGSSLQDCNVRLALPLSSDAGAASAAVQQLRWPGSPAHVAGALAVAGGALAQEGRQDAQSIVLVMTQGRPLSSSRTAAAAEAIERAGKRVTWVLLGNGVPQDEAATWASQPTRDNVFMVASDPGAKLNSFITDTEAKISELVSAICPAVDTAAAR